MQNWQRELRQEVHTNLVFLSIWQLRFGQGGFDPKQFPGGTGTPVTINSIQQVFIRFTPFLLPKEVVLWMRGIVRF